MPSTVSFSKSLTETGSNFIRYRVRNSNRYSNRSQVVDNGATVMHTIRLRQEQYCICYYLEREG